MLSSELGTAQPQLVPKPPTMNRKCKYELLISGLKIYYPDYFVLNKIYLLQSKITLTKQKVLCNILICSSPIPINYIFQVSDIRCYLQCWNFLLYIVFCKYFHLFTPINIYSNTIKGRRPKIKPVQNLHFQNFYGRITYN